MVSISLLAAGCATFSQVPPRMVGIEPYPHGSLAVEVVEWSYQARADGRYERLPEPQHGESVLAALAESGWFSPVGPGVVEPDFHARVTVRRYQAFPYGVMLSALSVFLVPTRLERQVAVSMTLRGPAAIPARCGVRSSYDVWYQAFLLPFGQRPRTFEADLVRRLTLMCLDQLLESLYQPEPEA